MSGGTVFRVLVRFEVPAGGGPAFEQAWEVMAAAARAHPGNLEQWLSVSSDGVYVVVTDWADVAGYTEFQSGPAHAAAGADLRKCWTSVSVTKTALVRHLLPGAAAPEPTTVAP